MFSHNDSNRQRRRGSRSRSRSSVGSHNDDNFDITNNAFASAILTDEATDDISDVDLRNSLVESILTHEAAVVSKTDYDDDEEEDDEEVQDTKKRSFSNRSLTRNPGDKSRRRMSNESGQSKRSSVDDADNFSFRPPTGSAQLPRHEAMKQRSNKSVVSQLSANSRRSGRSIGSDDQQQKPRPGLEKKTSTSSLASGTGSIISAGLSSIRVQISELDRMLMYHKESGEFGDKYEVPLPKMPHETPRANYLRLAIGLICMGIALTITLCFDQGQFGQASASLFYNTFILHGDEASGPPVLNDETTMNGSHLFQKVETLEQVYRRNVLGEPKKHLPAVTFNDGFIEVSVFHEMTKEHYIEFIWLKDVNKNKIVLARSFNPLEAISPILKAKVPSGVTLQAFLFCNKHELWAGEKFQVP